MSSPRLYLFIDLISQPTLLLFHSIPLSVHSLSFGLYNVHDSKQLEITFVLVFNITFVKTKPINQNMNPRMDTL